MTDPRAVIAARVARVRTRAGWRAYHLLRRAARRAGYHLVRANYYSPIPDTATLPPAVWEQPAPSGFWFRTTAGSGR